MNEYRNDDCNRHEGGIGWGGQRAPCLICRATDSKRALGAPGTRSRRDAADLAGSEIDMAHDLVIPFSGETKPVIEQ